MCKPGVLLNESTKAPQINAKNNMCHGFMVMGSSRIKLMYMYGLM
jgi:hypothetical protein